jgi:hypothetical protein
VPDDIPKTPVRPAQPEEPAESARAAEPARPAESARAAGTATATQPTPASRPAQTGGPARPTQPKRTAAPPQRPRRSWRWLFYLIVVILIIVAVLYFTGHLPGVGGKGGSTNTSLPPAVGNGFLATTSSSVILIQWNQTGTNTSGVAQMANVQGKAPNETIAVKTVAVTGEINDSNVSVAFKDVIQVFGVTSGDGFVLDFPQPDGSLAPVTFKKASAEDYNNALANLRLQVNNANASGDAGASSTTSTT